MDTITCTVCDDSPDCANEIVVEREEQAEEAGWQSYEHGWRCPRAVAREAEFAKRLEDEGTTNSGALPVSGALLGFGQDLADDSKWTPVEEAP